jgi:hypothetical protein
MTNRYLEILELNPGATKEEVKRAYRRLSKIYHPDISKSEDAKERFIEINEAYNFLSAVGPSPNAEPITYNYNPEAAAYQNWRKQARARARQKAHEAERLQQALIQQILQGFRAFFIFILVFNLLLAVDYLLPLKSYQEKLIKKEMIFDAGARSINSRNNHRYDEIEFENFRMRFNKNEIMMLALSQDAEVRATRIFKKPIEVTLYVNNIPAVFEQYYNIFKTFGFLIPIILGAMYAYSYKTETLDHKLTLVIFIAIVFIIQGLFFIKY